MDNKNNSITAINQETKNKGVSIPKNDGSFEYWKYYYSNDFKTTQLSLNPNKDWTDTLIIHYIELVMDYYLRTDKESDKQFVMQCIKEQKNQILAARLVLSSMRRIPHVYQYAQKWVSEHKIVVDSKEFLLNSDYNTSDESLRECFKNCALPLRPALFDICRAEIYLLAEELIQIKTVGDVLMEMSSVLSFINENGEEVEDDTELMPDSTTVLGIRHIEGEEYEITVHLPL